MPPDDSLIHPVYDFVYRDTARLASLYAQLNSGLLTSIERAKASREAVEKVLGSKGGVDVVVTAGVEGSIKTVTDGTDSGKQVYAPGDLIAIEAIAALVGRGYVSEDIVAAPNSSLIVAEGTLAFGDGVLLKRMIEAHKPSFIEQAVGDKVGKHIQPARAEAERNFNLLAGSPIPSLFQLHTVNNESVIGCLKDGGLEEPISSFYYRHGASLLPNMKVIGVKEKAGENPALAQSPFVTTTHLIAKAMSEYIFPADAIRVTPLAIYRKLAPLPKPAPTA